MERVEAVRNTGLADKIVLEEYKGQKIDDIQKYKVDVFTVGSDWAGYFDYLKEYCEVVYLPRTEGISSTQLREQRPIVRIGIIGTGSIAKRFVPESRCVNSIDVVSVYNPDAQEAVRFCKRFEIDNCAASVDDLLSRCDAVYIASPHYTHFDYARQALLTMHG